MAMRELLGLWFGDQGLGASARAFSYKSSRLFFGSGELTAHKHGTHHDSTQGLNLAQSP